MYKQLEKRNLNRDVYVARSYAFIVIGGEGEGSAEYATEYHIFNFMENYMYLKIQNLCLSTSLR